MSSFTPLSFVALWLFVLALSAVTALMEIQIEGGNGWAANLPTWRIAPKWLLPFLNGKDLTGYHLYLQLHLLILFHFPILLEGFSWGTELTIISVFLAAMTCEDFLWFVLNPHFGWQSFKMGNIAWFKAWFGPFPIDYYLWLTVSALCAILRGTLAGAPADPTLGSLSPELQQLIGWGVGFLVAVTVMTMIILVTRPRIARFQAADTEPHPGHPGIGLAFLQKMRMEDQKKTYGKSKRNSRAAYSQSR